jgi:hypothetical protein
MGYQCYKLLKFEIMITKLPTSRGVVSEVFVKIYGAQYVKHV